MYHKIPKCTWGVGRKMSLAEGRRKDTHGSPSAQEVWCRPSSPGPSPQNLLHSRFLDPHSALFSSDVSHRLEKYVKNEH